MKRLLLSLFFTVSIAGAMIGAQTTPVLKGFILNAVGSGFSIYRQGVFTTHSGGEISYLGFPLYAGDLVYTNGDAVLDIQLLPGSSRLQAGENTSFQLPAQSDENQVLNLLYGRLHVINQESFTMSPISYLSSLLVLGRGAGEFCIDQYIDAKGKRRNEVSALSGTVVIIRPQDVAVYRAQSANTDAGKNAGSEISSYNLQQGKGVSLSAAESKTGDGAKNNIQIGDTYLSPYTDLSRDISDYWKRRTIISSQLAVTKQSGVFGASQTWPKDEAEVQSIMRLIRTLMMEDQPAPIAASAQAVKTDKTIDVRVDPLAPRLADSVEPLDYIDPAVIINKQVFVYQEDPGKTAGIWMGLTGSLVDLLAVTIKVYGNAVFGATQENCDTAAIVLGSTGSALLVGGVVTYIVSLFN